MPAVRAIRPTSLFSQEQWRALTSVSRWRGLWLVAHAWGSVALILSVATWLGPLAWLPAVLLLGGRQLGLAILMHDAAHGLLHPDRRLNNWAGDWACGAAVGSDLKSYRAYHLTHHRYTQQPEDPDLGLSAPFPTARASLMRKVLRDLTAQTFYKQRRAQFALAWRGVRAMLRGVHGTQGRPDAAAGTVLNRSGIDGPMVPQDAAAVAVARSVGRFLTVQATILAVSLIAYGWTPFLLWLAALATTFQLFLRVRNIAEHACTSTGGADPFTHARTTRANLIERATVAPYWVNFHAEHHLFMGLPCYRLPAAHRLLAAHHDRMTIAPGYIDVLRQVVRA